jgi:hypothetical protein
MLIAGLERRMPHRLPIRAACIANLALVAGLAMGAEPSPTLADQPLHVRIDKAIEGPLSGPPAAQSTDAEFLRRAYLDFWGMVPNAAEARAFLDDPSPYKRDALIDRLLAGPEFARRMQQVFDVMWMERRPEKHVPAAQWQEYLYRSFVGNKPLDRLAAEIMAADGTRPELRPAARFYLDREGESNLVTRDVGRMFFGMDLQCCQCHDHPLIDGYKQEDYYGLLAFFSRSFVFTDPAKVVFVAERADGNVSYKSVFDGDGKEQSTLPHVPGETASEEPELEKGQEYYVPPADNVRPVPRYSRRGQLAAAVTVGNEDFNRNLANRLWAILMGRGLIHPVDFCHPDNPPSHPELLDALAQELAAGGFDVRAFLKQLALSRAYQRSSELPPGVEPESVPPESFAVFPLKPLSPEQIAWSLLSVSGHVEGQRQAAQNELRSDRRLMDILAAGDPLPGRFPQLVESTVYERLRANEGVFVGLFGGVPGQPAGEFQATVQQALFFMNGDVVRGWMGPGSGLVNRLSAIPDGPALAEELYLSVLSRRPAPEEAAELTEFLTRRSADRDAAIGELCWALATSTEFRFNH